MTTLILALCALLLIFAVVFAFIAYAVSRKTRRDVERQKKLWDWDENSYR